MTKPPVKPPATPQNTDALAASSIVRRGIQVRRVGCTLAGGEAGFPSGPPKSSSDRELPVSGDWHTLHRARFKGHPAGTVIVMPHTPHTTV
ncbi:MAG: hypothetical protein AMXMBFR4_16600 [Candidatus Hydrogenedentota bacterium]